ncbi:hypothetical protein Q8791_05915 [Nocardiopsis sp. CT-R113]|uniref:Lipoprotein n=1 Tax=Nocardiopsis codii TaxID=3065942 RepID=A0ABU7K3D6_9ACTN|nr:hypothetical protein [Nocardiopsis sp. CT-R113]MEE2036758.1 hypothetical protein [Nocardiopsis sp. CT-R113]
MRRLLLPALPLALLLAATACAGGEEAPEASEQAEESDAGAGGDANAEAGAESDALRAAGGFLASLQAVDGEAGCALIDPAAQNVLVEAHGAADCAEAFPAYAESLPDAEGAEVGEAVMGTDLDGDTPIATVTLVFAGGDDPGALELRQDSDDQWLATRLPGTSLGGA